MTDRMSIDAISQIRLFADNPITAGRRGHNFETSKSPRLNLLFPRDSLVIERVFRNQRYSECGPSACNGSCLSSGLKATEPVDAPRTRQARFVPFAVDSLQHPLQFLHALLNLRLQFAEAFEDFARRAVRDFFVDDFLVAVEREVVALRGDVGFGDAEALRGARRSSSLP